MIKYRKKIQTNGFKNVKHLIKDNTLYLLIKIREGIFPEI